MRYPLFILLALLIHALLFSALWLEFKKRGAARGGSEGGTMTVSIVAVAPQSETGRTRVITTPQVKGKRGADRGEGKQLGSGVGSGAGQGIGAKSGTSGGDPMLAEIRHRIEAAKRFPLLARRLKMAGTSELVFQLKPDGSIASLDISRTSGTKILDKAALETIRRAAPFPYYSEPLRISIIFDWAKE